jgi:hypothetical protein
MKTEKLKSGNEVEKDYNTHKALILMHYQGRYAGFREESVSSVLRFDNTKCLSMSSMVTKE